MPPPPTGLQPPPGDVSHQSQPSTTAPLGRVGGLSKAIVVLSVLVAGGTVLTALLNLTVVDAADDFLAGNIDEDTFVSDYAIVLLGQGVASIAQLALGIISVIWLYRVAKNLRAYRRATTWAPIWAVFGWILPPVLIIIPFLMVREVWRASDPRTPYGSDSWKQESNPAPVLAWFIVYGVGSVVIAIAQAGSVINLGFNATTEDLAENISDFGTIGFIAAVQVVVSAVLWIMVVRDTSARHMQLTGEN